MTHVFEMKNVSRRYGAKVVLDDFSLSGNKGEVIALLGENGAGKTTSLKVLLGFVRPDSGESTVFGLRSEQRSSEIRRRVGYVSDEPSLYDWMTVSEMGWFCAGFYEPGFNDRFRKHMETFGVELRQRTKSLSRGQRAKVSLALAMSHEPELLVMDEPTSGLDPVVRRQFLESMVDFAAQGRTVLLASHQVDEVERVADRVAIVKNGKLDVCESVESLKSSVREVRISWANGSTDLPILPSLNLLSRLDSNRQSSLFVNAFDESLADLWADAPEVSAIEVLRPSLEEIYVACMSSPTADGGAK